MQNLYIYIYIYYHKLWLTHTECRVDKNADGRITEKEVKEVRFMKIDMLKMKQFYTFGTINLFDIENLDDCMLNLLNFSDYCLKCFCK